MKTIIIIVGFLLSIGFVSCKKGTNQRDDSESNNEIVVFEDPYKFEEPDCMPDTNSIFYNGSKTVFESRNLQTHSGFIIESSNLSGEIIFQFSSKPRKQKYMTNSYVKNFGDNGVNVSGRFGSPFNTFKYLVVVNDTVYVDILDSINDIYSVTFCDLEFKARNLTPLIQTFRSDGNLRTK